MKTRFAFFLSLAMVAQMALWTPRAEALITVQFGTSGDWDEAGNWVGGVLPWENASGDTVVDLTYVGATSMTVNSSPVWTGAQFGASEGTPFVVRRVTVSGGKTLRIETGGRVQFEGDSRILANSNGSTIIMTGGEIKSASSTLGGINLGGGHGGFTVSGTSVVDVADARPAYSSGIQFGSSTAASGALHVIGSDVSISVEQIGFLAGSITTSYFPKFRFTFDEGGASAISVTDSLDLAASFNTISLQLYLESGLLDAPSTIRLFDLANGSVGAFDEVVTSRGTFAATEGTIVEIASADDPSHYLEYQLTYALDGTDIGLLAVPEPSAGLLSVLGLTLVTVLRRRR